MVDTLNHMAMVVGYVVFGCGATLLLCALLGWVFHNMFWTWGEGRAFLKYLTWKAQGSPKAPSNNPTEQENKK